MPHKKNTKVIDNELKYNKDKYKGKKKQWYKNILTTVLKKTNTKEFLTDFLEIPDEIISDITKVNVISNKRITIENYERIIDYYENYIKIRTKLLDIVIDGKRLDIKEITDTDLAIVGTIVSVNYSRREQIEN